MFNIAQFITTGIFKILRSFLLDGVNEYFTIPNAAFSSILFGTNKKFSITTLVKRVSIGTNQGIFGLKIGGEEFFIRFDTANTISFKADSGGVLKQARTTLALDSTIIWYFITISYDGTQSLGSRVNFFSNGVSLAKATDNLDSTIDNIATNPFNLGQQRGGINELNAYQNMFFITDTAMSLADHITMLNSGEPLNPQTFFGSNCKFFFNPDNSGSTAQFSVLDSVNSITATSFNLEDADKTTTTPY